MGPAVADRAVPVAGPDIGTRTEPERRPDPTAETDSGLAGPRVAAPLARVSSLEVVVLARPAVPISWPVHYFFPCTLH